MAFNIGGNIKKLRAEKGVTQEQLAEHLSITYQSVSKWENNITSPDLYLSGSVNTAATSLTTSRRSSPPIRRRDIKPIPMYGAASAHITTGANRCTDITTRTMNGLSANT